MTERSTHHVIDLTQEGSPYLEGLNHPLRVVEFEIGSILYRFARGADDPTPDNVLWIAGIYHNVTDGRIGKNLSDVIDIESPQK